MSLRTLTAELRKVLRTTLTVPILAEGMDEDLEWVAKQVEDALDEGAMDPFKRRAKLGPGPYGRRVAKRKTDRYKCRCQKQGPGAMCKCKSRRRRKSVWVSYDYKDGYNDVYRAWVRKRKRTRKKKPDSFFKQVAER